MFRAKLFVMNILTFIYDSLCFVTYIFNSYQTSAGNSILL